MRLRVAVTDNHWFRFLRSLPDVDEVNFWMPGGGAFKAIAPGEPLLFKLHHPENYIAGGGFFVRYVLFPGALPGSSSARRTGPRPGRR
jgi:putative restriction endonuclease